MDGKLIQSEMKPAPGNFTARVGVWVIAVFVICAVFLFCNYLLVNQRISTMEGKLESLQRSEKPNPNVSFDDQRGAKQVLHTREKRSVKQKTQVSNMADFEKRLQALEKRVNANNHSVMPPKEPSDWWFHAYFRGRDGRDGREGLMGPPGPPGKPGTPGTSGKPGTPGISGKPGTSGSTGTQGPKGPPGQKGDRGAVGAQGAKGEKGKIGKSGAKYVRWGRTTCPSGAEIVYKGLIGGDYYTHQGGGVNYLCLPHTPKYDKYKDGWQASGYVYGTEYEVSGFNPFKKNLHDHEAPCAVCFVKSRGSMLMMPARNDCPPGWTEEYHGYLMTEYYNHKKQRDYICVDEDAEYVPGSQGSKDGALLYPVQGSCGALPCLPYVNGRELTCAVCTK